MPEKTEDDFLDTEMGRNGISLVWLVPIAALLISLAVAWRTYAERGPLIEIVFSNAAGIEAGKTPVKRKDVKVGVVEEVDFTEDGARVLVRARIDKPAARYLDAETQFWVVTPQISVEGITGLDTVLSGSYIEASWDSTTGEPATRFEALVNPPQTPPDQPGRRIRLIAEDGGSMSVGAPVFYKRIEVGRIESKALTSDGEAVVFDLFIEAPHHLRVSAGSRFWNASGFEMELGAEGAKMRVESLVSLLRGGIAFDTVAFGGAPIQDFQLFRLFPTEREARASIFDDDYGAQIRLSIAFDGSIRGLSVGAPVELRGYKVGEVVDVTADVDQSGISPKVSLITTVLLQPSRLGLPTGDAQNSLDFLKSLVRGGLRAKLASANLLTGALYVQLVQEQEAESAEIDETAIPYPRLPSVNSDFDDLAASAEGVLNRINNLPLEELLTSATTLLNNLNTLAADAGTRQVPGELAALLSETRGLVANPALTQAVEEIAGTAAASRALVEQINEAGAVASLTAALAAAGEAAEAIRLAAADAPDVMANISALSKTARELPLEALIGEATGFVTDARALVASDGVSALPEDLSRTLAEVESLLAELRETGAAQNLSAALAEVGEAAQTINIAAAEAPELIRRLSALSAKAQDLPLEDLLRNANLLVSDLDRLVVSEDTQQTPGALRDALASMRTLIDELRAAGTVSRLAVALDDAGQTARSITVAAQEVPDFLASIEALSAKLQALPMENLVAAANRLIADLDRIATAPGAEQIPGALVASLDQVRMAVGELQARNVPENFNNALISFDGASRSFQVLSSDLQAVLPRVASLATRADTVLSSLDVGSELNYEAVTMIREIRDAARAITILANSVERKPNSLLLGK